MKRMVGSGAVLGMAACLAFTTLVGSAEAASTDVEQDLGPAPPTDVVDVSLILKLRHADLLEKFVANTEQPGAAAYHRFLSVPEFVSAFAPGARDIATVTRYLARFGISVTEVYADRLVVKARGSLSAFESAFSVDVHDYSVQGRRFRRGRQAPTIPLLLRDLLIAVTGTTTEPLYQPRHVRGPAVLGDLGETTPTLPANGATSTGVPGSYTVGDAADRYGVTPLYDNQFDGTGRRLGIATLADFDPVDAYTYWTMVGLDVDAGRIVKVRVDGGGLLNDPNDPGGPDASLETTLDVEQAGGLAPGADVVVYDAPNDGAGFLDVFYRAVSDNVVDSLSTSWGSAEVLAFDELGGDGTAELVALHQALLEAAAQGISVFAASGDSGAYDLNTGVDQPIDNVLGVDSPASDPAITAAGGTTTPFSATFAEGAPDFVVATERVWGWRDLEAFLVKNVDPSFEGQLFPTGGGGGVSVFWARPQYQNGTPGTRLSEPGQSIVLDDGSGPVDLLDLNAGFAGRNLPDVSLDADPLSGYLVYQAAQGGLVASVGGTSVVAPQLAGIAAVVAQALGTRLGAYNPMLYRFKQSYRRGSTAPLVDVTSGDNWFYRGVPGYEPGAGLGVLAVSNFVAAVERESGGR
jgi:kumamolisin